MSMSRNEYKAIIDYLLAHTTYKIENLTSYPDGQLYSMKKRIQEAMYTYPKEIFDYYKEHPLTQPRYTYDELTKMKYNELAEIRKSLKIRGGKKKVVTMEPAIEKAQEASNYINNATTNQVAAAIISSNSSHDYQERDEYQFITMQEAISMYGDDVTEDYLERHGFKLYDSQRQSYQSAKTKEKYELIDDIISLDVSIKGEQLTIEDLLDLEIEELQYFNFILSSFKEKKNDQKGFKI